MQDRTERQLNRRSKLEAYFSIIEVVGAGNRKPTHIMYKANLSWVVMQDYIRKLERKGIIAPSEADGRKTYELTQKGFVLLEKYLEIKDNFDLPGELSQTVVRN